MRSQVLCRYHVPEDWRRELEDALDVLSKGCRIVPLAPWHVRHLVESDLLDVVSDLLALRLIGRGISPLITSLQSLSSGMALMRMSYFTSSPSAKRHSLRAMLMKSSFLFNV